MTDKTPRAWDGALEQEFYTPEEIAASDARVGEIHREKVMRDLLEACAYFKSSFDAMNGTLACETMYRWAHSIADAVDLLKAQEPIEPEVDVDEWRCGKCGHPLEHQEMLGSNILFHEQYAYCPNCGRKVKWA